MLQGNPILFRPRAALAALLLLAVPLFTAARQTIRIGGLFTLTNQQGTSRDEDGIHHLAAFNMALKEINDDQDLLPGYVFNTSLSSPFDFYDTIESTMKLNKLSFMNSPDNSVPAAGGIDCAVGAVDTERTMASNEMFARYKTVQVSSVASGAELSVGTKYPLKARTVPSESFQGMVLQDIIYSHFNYRKVSIFCTTEFFAGRAAWDFSDGTFGVIEILSFHQVVTGGDFQKEIDLAKSAGSLVFVLFMGAADAANLLLQGRAAGLFRQGTIIFGHERIVSTETIAAITQADPTADVGAVLKGFIGVKFDPSFSIKNTPKGKEFVTRWKSQTPASCTDGKKDGDGDFYIHRFQNTGICLTLNFPTVDPIPAAALTYDATYLLAHALHTVLITNKVPIHSPDLGDKLMEAMFTVEFVGATGLIKVFDGVQPDASVGDEKFGRGDREAGETYEISNFDPTTKTFVSVGRWDVESAYQLCDSMEDKTLEGEKMPCANRVKYDTSDNLPPPDRPPTIYRRLPAAVSALLYALGVIAIVIVVVTASLIVYYRNSRLIKASQPPLMAIILVGELVACARVIIGGSSELGSPVLDGVCAAKFWTGHLSFALAFGSLLTKTWRVNKVLNSQSMRRVKISNNFVLAIMLAASTVLGIYLAIATSVGQPRVVFTEVVKNNQATVSMTCGLKYPQFETVLFVIEAVLLVWGARLCYATQNVPDAINESKFIAASMSIVVLICALVVPIIYLLGLDSIVIEIIASLSFWLSVVSTVCILYYPKLIILLGGGDADDKFGIGKGPPNKAVAEAEKEDSLRNNVHGTAYDAMRTACLALLKGKTLDEKFAMAQGEILWWRSILVQIEEKRTSSATGPSGNEDSRHSRSSVHRVHDGDEDSELDKTTALTVTRTNHSVTSDPV